METSIHSFIQRYGWHLYILITIAEAFAAGLYIGANI
jgi:hypothetical protein